VFIVVGVSVLLAALALIAAMLIDVGAGGSGGGSDRVTNVTLAQ